MRVNPDASSVSFIHPFSFENGAPNAFDKLIRLLVEQSYNVGRGEKARSERVWERNGHSALKDDLLPHVGDFIADEGSEKPGQKRNMHSFILSPDFIQNPKTGLNAKTLELCVDQRKGQGESLILPLDLLAVELSLFRTGIGFLTLKVGLQTNDVTKWQNLQHYFRFYTGSRGVQLRHEPLDDTVAAGGAEGDIARKKREAEIKKYRLPAGSTVETLIQRILGHAGGCLNLPNQPLYSRDQLMVWACSILEDVDPQFDAQFMNRLQYSFRSDQGLDLSPSAQAFENADWIYGYGERKWFYANLNSAGFVSFKSGQNAAFVENTMPGHVHQSYRPLYLLALHQRFFIQKLSRRVANWLPSVKTHQTQKDADIFESLREEFLAFNADGYFYQVHHEWHYHRAYRLFCEINSVSSIFQEVRDEIADIHGLLDMRRSRHIESGINRFGIILGVVGVIGLPLAFLGINLSGITTLSEGLSIEEAMLWGVGTGLLFSLILFIFNRLASIIENPFSKPNRSCKH